MLKVQREKIQSGWKRYKSFEGEGGMGGAALVEGRPDGLDEHREGIQVGKVRDEVTVLVSVRSPEEAGSQQEGQL